MIMITEGTRVAIVDDVERQAETAAGIAEEAGLDPSIISETDGTFEEAHQLLERVQATACSAVICDHRLSQTQFASFSGAEFVSVLYRKRIPAVLLSTFSAIDSDTSIRLHRAHIPALINRGELGPAQILGGLKRCERELAGNIVPERQARRTLVRIVDVLKESDTPVADAILHTWNPDRAVRFPLALIQDSSIRGDLTQRFSGEARLFAEVNIGCRDENELFFKSFERAPEPNVDGLAT